MDINTYQEKAEQTAIYQSAVAELKNDDARRLLRVAYTALGLAGEAGELANKVKKAIRGDNIETGFFSRAAIAMELGDVLWYLAMLAREIDYPLVEIAQLNLEKLSDREERGTIAGQGDDR